MSDNSNLQIRPFSPADVDALQAIRSRAFEPVFRSFRAITGPGIAEVAFASAEAEQERHLAGLCAPDAKEIVFVAEVDGRPVGFVAIALDTGSRVGEIGLNAVDPDYAGRGIGTGLYEFALDHMRASGMKVASVGTGGDASHAPARRAYEKVGFGPALPTLWLYRKL